MKRLLKASIKILVICLTLTLVNCEKEDDYKEWKSAINQSRIGEFKLIPNSELQKNQTINRALGKFDNKSRSSSNSTSNNAREIYSDIYDFTIDTDFSLLNVEEQYKTYTFIIKRENPNIDILENLVIDIDTITGEITQLLFKYPINNDDSYDFENLIIEEIYDPNLTHYRFSSDCYYPIVYNTYSIPFNCGLEGNHSPGEVCGDGVERSGIIEIGEWVEVETCPSGAGSTSPNPNPTYPNNHVNSSGLGGLSTAPFNEESALVIQRRLYLQQIISCLGPVIAANANPALIDWLSDAETNYLDIKKIATYLGQNISGNPYDASQGTNCDNPEALSFAAEAISAIQGTTNDINNFEDFVAQDIVDNIDDTELDDCEEGILDDLKDLEQVDIAEIFKRFDTPNTPYQTKLKTINFTTDTDPITTIQNAVTGWNGAAYKYLIRVNENYSDDATNLSIATTLMHELIHVYLLSLADDSLQTNNPTLENDFPVLWNWYVDNKYGGDASLIQHEIIASHYVDILARSLQEYHTGNAVGDNDEPLQVYKDISWGGLLGTEVFNQVHPPFSDSRARIDNRIWAEKLNILFVDQEPIGEPCI
ncbi:MAG: hypothetical protein ACPG41_07130 [Lacinutrix venerupis]